MRGLEHENRRLPPKGPPPSARIILLLIASVALMMFDHGSQTLAPVRNTLASALVPLQVIAQWPADAYSLLFAYTHRDELVTNNDSLRHRVLLLESKLEQLAALRAENQRLRNLLSSTRSLEEQV
ncbi:MAG: rod shape-determining protein MreC, partial [Salinisphaera sp.]|nr:rod shape-determining protein MreC [Salinisphaera sp.]